MVFTQNPEAIGTFLIVDSNPNDLAAIARTIQPEGYRILEAAEGNLAMDILQQAPVDVLITGLTIPNVDGLALLRTACAQKPPIPVIVVTDSFSIESAVEAMKIGAVDCITKPLKQKELKNSIHRALERRMMLIGPRGKEDITGFGGLIGSSPAMQVVFKQIRQVAPLKSTVLITGESGTGKELVAHAIHALSPRRDGPIIPVNCSALPEELVVSQLFGHEKGSFTGATASHQGLFEAAHNGTLFLDEIADLALEAQAKLLRALEDRQIMRVGSTQTIPVDVRLIAATNTDLETAVQERRFREDLYYRLKVFTTTLPPLRQRPGDIPQLVRVFLDRFTEENDLPPKMVTSEAIEVLSSYPWPGNVRELKNLVESLTITVTGPRIQRVDLPPGFHTQAADSEAVQFPIGMSMEEVEEAVIKRTLEHTRGNRTHAARILKIGLRTLQRKIKQFGLI